MIKQLVVCLFMVICYLESSSQINDGSLWLGGNISFGSTINEVKEIQDPQSKTRGLTLAPYFGKSIDENSVLGINLVYKRSKENYTGPAGRITNDYDYGGGVFYRNYRALGKGFYFYADCELGYIYATRSLVSAIDPADFRKSKIHNISLIAYPGLSYAVRKNILLEIRTGNLVNLSYFVENKHLEWPVNNKRDERVRTLGLQSSFNELFNNFGLGFRFLLGGERAVSN